MAAPRDRTLAAAARLVSFAVVCGILYWGRVVLVPIALAALVTFLLGPLVTRLDRIGLPRAPSAVTVVALLAGLLGGIGWIVGGQVARFAEELPAYQDNIRGKFADLRELTRDGTIESVQTTIEELSEDIERDAAAESAARGEDVETEEEPVRVEIAAGAWTFGDGELLGSVAGGAATGGLALLLSVFMLIKREEMRNRIVSLAGQTSLAITTKAMSDAGRRISRYLLMQFIINATMGIAVWLGLLLIGVPYAALWGLSAAVLRYIPYVGPWIAALLPITVSLVTSPGWMQVTLVIAMFVAYELLSNNVMEPWLYGQSVGLSSIAVIVSVIFWTWLWGPVGLLLATPLTACLVVVSRYVPELEALDRLLGERPALKPHVWLYQRLLARDEEEAERIVATALEHQPLAEVCEEVLLGALLMLKRDVHADRISAEDGEFVATALSEIADDLPAPANVETPTARADAPVLLIGLPAQDPLDGIPLELLRVLLAGSQRRLEILPPRMLVSERIGEIEARAPAAVCIASLPPGDLTATRHLLKRLRSRLPHLAVVVGRLGASDASERSRRLLESAGAARVVGTLAELYAACAATFESAAAAERARRRAGESA